MKKYISPNIECFEIEPLQLLAGSTPSEDNKPIAPGEADSEVEVDAKQHTGAFDADWD